MDRFFEIIQYAIGLYTLIFGVSILILAWEKRTCVMRLIRCTLGWMLFPYVALVTLIWCIIKNRKWSLVSSLRRHLDRMIYRWIVWGDG